MSDHHAAQELLGEFGRSTGLGELALDEDNYCALLIEFDEQDRQLVLYSLLGEPAGDRLPVYERLLQANYLGRECGGATFGLRPGNSVVLSQSMAVAGLDLKDFTARLERFINEVEAWTKQLPQLGAASDAGPAEEFPVIRG
jgi:Tir chaperone protein (CesT) family